MNVPRYPPTFRQDEIYLICQSALSGESLCFVGLAGSGKSNITNFLCVDPYGYKPQYLDPQTERVLFLKINAETWSGSPQNLWEQMWTELVQLTHDWIPAESESNIIGLSEEASAFIKLREQVDLVCGQHQRQLMFILDDFDGVFETGPLHMLEQLNRLRSNHRGQLSYLIFTKKLPHILGRAYNLETVSKFYDLFKNHVYALKLYGAADMHQMLLHLNALHGNTLNREALLTIEGLCGGHARLLRLLFDLWRHEEPMREPPVNEDPLRDASVNDDSANDDSANDDSVNDGSAVDAPENDVVQRYATHADMRKECERILNGLHRHEKLVAVAVAQGKQRPEDREVMDHLLRRGLLISLEPPKWFSLLMETYLKSLAED